jgi:hypothetical protein
MFRNKHIQVVTLPNERFRDFHLVSRLARLWREQGYRVTVGPTRRLDADIGILHVDRTLVPAQCVPENPEGRPFLNASMLDISKRRISSNLVGKDSNHTGQVIVKTNANTFGRPERADKKKSIKGRFFHLLGHAFSRGLKRELLCDNYPVLDNLDCVPEWVWKRDDLVVEKFLPEVEGNEFALRIWIFFGDQEYGARLFSRNPVVKVRGITRYEYIYDVPETLRQVRRELGMDFGKFDYVMVNGEAVLLDVNKTPAVRGSQSPGSNVRRLASGLASYLEGT